MRSNKKKMSVFLVGIFLVMLFLSGCGGSKKTLYIYNWTEYMPQSVYDEFEKETGIHVVESTFSSNEEMLAKLKAGGTSQYDLIIASNYIIPAMESNKMIQKLDKSKIPNMKNISSTVMGLDYDKQNEYCVPYQATMTVLAVNKKKLDKLGVTIESLNDLQNSKLKDNIVVVDDSRELAAVALKATGKDDNSTDKATIEGSLNWLKKLTPNIKAYDSDSPKTLLATNEVAVGLVYNIDAGQAIKQNKDITVVYTSEPCEYSIDNFVLSSKAKNKEYAEEFINFVHEPKVYKEILNAFPGVCLNDAAKKLMDSSYLDNPGSNVDPDQLAKAHLIKDVGDAASYYDDVYTQMKTN